jgi:ferredoxin-NADP reductase
LPAIDNRLGLGRRLLHSPLVEALAYPHGVDRYVELVRPLLVRDARAEIAAVRHQTDKSVTLTLLPNENWRGLRAGQFVNLSVEIDGVRETRPYSPSGSQHAAGGALELTISTHPEGKVSRYLRYHARPGMVVGLSQAQGDFTLPDERPERVLLISGGSGITPALAILRTLCDEGSAREVAFLNYARSPELALYETELRELAGRFCAEHVEQLIGDAADAATFVCGPPALIDAVRALWSSRGLPEPTAETFTPPAIAFDPATATGMVRFAASDREAENSGLPLLEQAEDAGLAPDHGCRMGICNTCSCRKVSGAVRNALTGEISTAEDEPIRICVSVPLGDVELDL